MNIRNINNKKKLATTLFSVISILIAGVAFYGIYKNFNLQAANNYESPANFESQLPLNQNKKEEASVSEFAFPMDNALKRITKKHFGKLIIKGQSPVENDRFSGYHVGTDFEAFEDELEIELAVYAICDGPMLFKQFANGYGGMMAQRCELNGEPITVVYGHLDLKSITPTSNEFIAKGDTIGYLGDDHSEETDGVRKHLHLGVRKGTEIDIRGYVHDKNEIANWIDPVAYMPQK